MFFKTPNPLALCLFHTPFLLLPIPLFLSRCDSLPPFSDLHTDGSYVQLPTTKHFTTKQDPKHQLVNTDMLTSNNKSGYFNAWLKLPDRRLQRVLKRSCRILPCSLVPLPAPVPFQCFPEPVNREHVSSVLSLIYQNQTCMNGLWELLKERGEEVQSRI